MRGFLRSNTFKILLIVMLIMSAVLILSSTVGNVSLGTLLGFVTTPMQEVSAKLTEEEEAKLETMTRAELKEYGAQLSAENAQLRQQLVDYYDLKQKNKQFGEALKIQEKNLDLELYPATVISRDPADIFGGFSIDAGYLDGISAGDPVITAKGIVGVVTESFAMSSRVTTILSEDVKVGAIAKEFKENGVVTGSGETAAVGSVRMDYLTKSSKLQQGTVITTSGEGGLFPKDLIIGQVSYLGSSQTDVSLFAVVQPYEDISLVSEVFIITNFPGKDEGAPAEDSGEAGQ